MLIRKARRAVKAIECHDLLTGLHDPLHSHLLFQTQCVCADYQEESSTSGKLSPARIHAVCCTRGSRIRSRYRIW